MMMKIFNNIKNNLKKFFNYFVRTLETIIFITAIDFLLLYYIINNSLYQFCMCFCVFLIINIQNWLNNKR